MEFRKSILLVFAIVVTLMASPVQAFVANPDPVNYFDDSGSELFLTDNTFLGLELHDINDALGLNNLSFGFFFEGNDPTDPANRVYMFKGPDDITSYVFGKPIPSHLSQVDNGTGWVTDLDTPGLKDTFITQPPGSAIGFFIEGAQNTFYTTAALNPQDDIPLFDYVGVFRNKDPELDDFIIGFQMPAFTALAPAISYHEIMGITSTTTSSSVVPLPPGLLLLGSGLLGLISIRRLGFKNREH